MWTSSRPQHDRTARRFLRGALAGVAAAGLLLASPALATAAAAAGPGPQATAVAKPPAADAQHRISPYVRASRARAAAPRPEFRPRLRAQRIR